MTKEKRLETTVKAMITGRMPIDDILKEAAKISDESLRGTKKTIDITYRTDAAEKVERILGKEGLTILCSVFQYMMVEVEDPVSAMYYRLLLEKVIDPLATEVENLRTMVRTLTISKEVNTRNEEE